MRRENITVRGQSYMSLVYQNIDPLPPSPPGESVLPPPKKTKAGYTLARKRGGLGVNILEDERLSLRSHVKEISMIKTTF
jgi:hypothetical protein